jgi:lipopolysaccharide export system ATP-binding protein
MSTTGSDHCLSTDKLVKSYRGRQVVNRVSVKVRKGEIVGLLGPNGAGKTTTFYMILGLIKPNSGQVFLDGRDITALPMYLRAKSGISYLPQEASIFRKLTVEENLLAILESLKLTAAERARRLDELLNELGVAHLAKHKAYSLSGGERRRVEISRSLVISPFFILLDEPFAGIDPKAVQDIRTLIMQLRDKGIGILITDHNVRDTLKTVNRAYIIKEGEIFRHGSPSELAEDEEVRQIYLGNDFSLN